MIRVANLSASPRYFRWEFIHSTKFNFHAWIKEKLWVWDCDICNDVCYYYVVIENDVKTFYKIEHSYYRDYSSDYSDGFSVENYFEIERCLPETLGKYAKENLRFVV